MLRVKSPETANSREKAKTPYLLTKDDEPEFIYDFNKALSPQAETPEIKNDKASKARALRLSGLSMLSSQQSGRNNAQKSGNRSAVRSSVLSSSASLITVQNLNNDLMM